MDSKGKTVVKEQTIQDAAEMLRAPAAAPLVPLPLEVLVPEARQQTPAVRQRAARPDCRLHGLGQTKYIDDMYLPGMLFCKIKRAGVASARVLSIDTTEAEAMPGVVAVITGKDVPCNTFGPSLKDQPVLADSRVFHAGDGVAAVAAVTEQIAADALDKIKVEYEILKPVIDPLLSLDLETPGVHAPNPNIYGRKMIKKGDIDKGFAESDHIFEATFRTQMVEHVPLEPHSSLATWDANGRLTLYSTLGRITLGRADVARTLAMPMSRVRIIATIVGGNFGGKNEITTEPVVALLAKKTGRPVKCTFTRPEEFVSSTTRHPLIMDYKTGVTKQGKITARKIRLVLDGGAYCSWSETTLGKACILSAGPYNIDNLVVEAYVVYTNKTMTGAMRGFKRRGFCPSCGARRMVESAAHLVDHVFPEAPVRQFVLTFPFPLRFLLASNPKALTEVLAVVQRGISTFLIRQAGLTVASGARTGAVTLIQRFGSALNLNPHLHMLFLDGAYRFGGSKARFHRARRATNDDLTHLLDALSRRIVRVLERRGLLVADPVDPCLDLEIGSSLDQIQAASINYRIAIGPHAGRKALTLYSVPPLEEEPTVPLLARMFGFSLHAGTVCAAHQRSKLERLCRYITRPPIASKRLSVDDHGRVVYRYKRPFRDGSTHVMLEPLDFIARLAALVPRPRLNLTRFHGIFAPNARHRHQIVPRRPRGKVDSDKPLVPMSWAQRLKRVFAIDIQRCPECGGNVRVIASIEDPHLIAMILAHVRGREAVTAVAVARGPPDQAIVR